MILSPGNMKKLNFSIIFILWVLFFCAPVQADEISTSTIEIPTTTIEIPTTTEIIPTTTIETPTTTPTTTPETPTTTPTSTIDTSTSTIDTTTTTTSTTEIGSGSTTPPANHLVDDNIINSAVEKILNFLRSKQDSDGKIIDIGTSDWVTMALGAHGIYADEIKSNTTSLLQYIYNSTEISGELNPCAGYPRHILALLAAGVDKTDPKIIEIKNKIITECNHEQNYGPDVEINDDIFAIMALVAVDENAGNQIVQKLTANINAKQQVDGGFSLYGYEGADITGVAINALKNANDHDAQVNPNIINKAKQYLKNTQLADGGWGWGPSDALTTSWALMGINALGENQNDWFNNSGKNPWNVLTEMLTDNGYYASPWSADGVDWFGTKHAAPALLSKSWPIILTPKSNQNNFTNTGGYFSSTTTLATATTTATTTLEISTTTTSTVLASSTINNATSTEEYMSTSSAPVALVITKTKKTKFKKQTLTTLSSQTPTNTSSDNPIQNNELTNQLINNLPLDTPTRQTAKKILEISGGGTLALGLYLGLKLFKGMI